MVLIKGDDLVGTEHFTNRREAEEFAATKRSDGFKVRIRTKFETFMGERLPVNPPSIRVSYEPEGYQSMKFERY